MVYGDNRLYNVALIVPDMDAVKAWAGSQGISADSDEKLLENAKVKAMMTSEVEKASAEFKGFEKVKRITLTAEDFTTQNDLLTPSLKVKRRVVWQKYGPQIEALYAEGKPASKGAEAEAS